MQSYQLLTRGNMDLAIQVWRVADLGNPLVQVAWSKDLTRTSLVERHTS